MAKLISGFHCVQQWGAAGLRYCESIGRAGVFIVRTLLAKPQFNKSFPLVVREIYNVGVLSAVIIIVSGLFIGMVVSMQGYNTLSKFGAAQELGQLLALSVLRELGPVVSALLFAGRAGSALTAEIALMKTTEQLASMEMMGVNPLWRIIAPRFWAGVISLPLLTLMFNAVAILGGYLIGVQCLGVDAGSFWNNMQSAVDFRIDLCSGLVKAGCFAIVVTWIAVFQGYNTVPTAAGISRATTRTVVYASLMVVGLDFILTAMMVGGW